MLFLARSCSSSCRKHWKGSAIAWDKRYGRSHQRLLRITPGLGAILDCCRPPLAPAVPARLPLRARRCSTSQAEPAVAARRRPPSRPRAAPGPPAPRRRREGSAASLRARRGKAGPHVRHPPASGWCILKVNRTASKKLRPTAGLSPSKMPPAGRIREGANIFSS